MVGRRTQDRMPHLALVCTSGGPFGGMETFMRSLLRWLRQDGWRITVGVNGFEFTSTDSSLCQDQETLPVEALSWVNPADLSGDRRYTRAAR